MCLYLCSFYLYLVYDLIINKLACYYNYYYYYYYYYYYLLLLTYYCYTAAAAAVVGVVSPPRDAVSTNCIYAFYFTY